MNKCDFCAEAILKNGVLICQNSTCVKLQSTLDKMRLDYLEALIKANSKNKKETK